MKYRVQLVAALAIALMFTGSLPSVAASDKTGSVWLPYWYMSTARPAVVKNSDLFKTASPFWYNATGCTKIVGYNGAGDRATIKALHDASMRVVPTVTATGITPQIAIQCLGNVDARAVHVAEVLRVMRSLAEEGRTMIVVTHEMGFARRAAHRVVFMADGAVVEDARPAEFFENPQSDRAKDFLSKILNH